MKNVNSVQVKGELRKKVHIGKWDLVIQKATRSLQELIRTASARRRNIIIDQVGYIFEPRIYPPHSQVVHQSFFAELNLSFIVWFIGTLNHLVCAFKHGGIASSQRLTQARWYRFKSTLTQARQCSLK